MGDRQLKDWISIVAALVAVISFGLTYIRSDGILFALGLMGLAYGLFSGAFVTVLFIRWGRRRRGLFLLLLIPFVLLVAFCTFGFVIAAVEDGFSNFNFLNFFGILGFLLAIVFGVGALHDSYTTSHKACPDCAETVLAKAHVCKHCGYRWSELTEVAKA